MTNTQEPEPFKLEIVCMCVILLEFLRGCNYIVSDWTGIIPSSTARWSYSETSCGPCENSVPSKPIAVEGLFHLHIFPLSSVQHSLSGGLRILPDRQGGGTGSCLCGVDTIGPFVLIVSSDCCVLPLRVSSNSLPMAIKSNLLSCSLYS